MPASPSLSPRIASPSSSKTSNILIKMSGSSPSPSHPDLDQVHDRPPRLNGAPRRTPAEIIQTVFTPFDQQKSIIDPFEAEARKAEEYRQKFRLLMMEIIVETQTWAASRSDSESRKASARLEQEMDAIAATEREQGRSSSPSPSSRTCSELLRLRLVQFVTNIKNALAMLTGGAL
ncbi:hypothetical protein OF83DRAFT_1109764 [Amylostereum chailletii]|nr:hypothetical protein OF83DRAFT_1109764 [Amylostereum chailletii]